MGMSCIFCDLGYILLQQFASPAVVSVLLRATLHASCPRIRWGEHALGYAGWNMALWEMSASKNMHTRLLQTSKSAKPRSWKTAGPNISGAKIQGLKLRG